MFEDEHLVAIDKPPNLAAHRSRLVGADDDYLVDAVRRQAGRTLYLAHRLDRATSGLVLFAASREVAAALGAQFMSRAIDKRYLAVCRGWPVESGTIDHPLDAPGKRVPRPAVTHWRRLATATVDEALGRYPQQRYALLELRPETGRYHQLRRHLKHVSHHLLGDTTHGRGEHNRLFRMRFGLDRLLLHAAALALTHPADGRTLCLRAPPRPGWDRVVDGLGWRDALDDWSRGLGD